MQELDIKKIMRYLPHRYPFLLIDKVTSYTPGKSLHAIKNITFNEPCFQGHFPGHPIFPGVLIIEAMAQASALLGCATMETPPEEGSIYYLVGVDKTRFKQTVHPGEQLHINVNLAKVRRNIWCFKAKATANDKLIASAELMTTVVDS